MIIMQDLTKRVLDETKKDIINGIVRLKRIWRNEREEKGRLMFHSEIENLEKKEKAIILDKYKKMSMQLDRIDSKINETTTMNRDTLLRKLNSIFRN